MGKDERKGARRDRNQRTSQRVPELGYYFVVTDTQATEINYLYGFRDSIPPELHNRLVIKVNRASTGDLVEKCMEMAAIEPQYRKPWIVFDRDQVKNFDQIITDAEKQDINVGWSNPCIEIWFHAYFGVMPMQQTSTQCNTDFEKAFQANTKQKYDKSDKDNYKKLCRFGNELDAIKIAELRHRQQCDNCTKPSDMLSTSTLYLLIGEIKKKIDAEDKE
ncbi:MAG: RloB family protein [Oscillospiraceae bacterium]|nr:RloB family protein [Oscillospiraceae bacterium]